MPTGTKVDDMFQALKREGHSVASAAKISQARTGLSLKTGRPPKKSSGKRGRNAMNHVNRSDGDDGFVAGNAMRV